MVNEGKSHNNKKYRKIYFVIGFIFGVVFPLVAFIIRASEFDTEKALSLMATDPLLWIICSAPLILAFAAYFAGIKQDEVKVRIYECKKTELELINANTKISKTIEQMEKNYAVLFASQKSEDGLKKKLDTAIYHFSDIIEKIGQFDLSVKLEKKTTIWNLRVVT